MSCWLFRIVWLLKMAFFISAHSNIWYLILSLWERNIKVEGCSGMVNGYRLLNGQREKKSNQRASCSIVIVLAISCVQNSVS